MSRDSSPEETLERLRKEAKRRLKAFRNGKENAVHWFRRLLPDLTGAPTLRDAQLALARSLDFPGWTALKRALETPLPEPISREGIVNRFLDNACPDHHVRGRQDHRRAEATAMRLLEQNPWLPLFDFNTAVVCGQLEFVRAAIDRDPRVATVPSSAPSGRRGMAGGANDLYEDLGPKGWPPLLYLAFTRLPLPAANENSLEIARLLLDAGADPNAFFHAGDSHYTPLTGVAGEGEEDRPPHPLKVELTQLLLERGAEPYDIQVVYDLGFSSEYLWWLPLIHERALKIGRGADWKDPEWKMLSMGGYGCGARWFLDHAINQAKPDLAKWCLEHGAGPNAPPARDPRLSKRSLYEDAVRAGQGEIAALLLQHGATKVDIDPEPGYILVDAALRGDADRVESLIHAKPELRQSHLALHRAAELNRADAIHLLLNAGISPDVADDKNMRALHAAGYANAADAARALIEHGAEIDPVEERYGGTPLGGSSHYLNREVMDLLAPRSRDVWNLTYNGYVERLREVLAEEPERARVDWDEWSPLLWLPPHDEDAALAIAMMLVEHGADPSLRAKNGATPLSRAEAVGMTRLAEYLREQERLHFKP